MGTAWEEEGRRMEVRCSGVWGLGVVSQRGLGHGGQSFSACALLGLVREVRGGGEKVRQPIDVHKVSGSHRGFVAAKLMAHEVLPCTSVPVLCIVLYCALLCSTQV